MDRPTPLPPPLPSPAAPPPPARGDASRLVDVAAKCGLVLGALAAVGSLALLVLAHLLEDSALATLAGDPHLTPPRALVFFLRHGAALAAGGLGLAAAFMLVCRGLLRRRAWARLGFIAFLLLASVAGFLAAFAAYGFYGDLAGMLPAEAYQEARGQSYVRQMRSNQLASLVSGLVAATCITTLNGWLALKFTAAQAKALFR